MNRGMNEKIEFVDGMSAWELVLKRCFDFCGAFLLLIIFSPLILIIWICLWMENEGSPVFKQERIGYQGKPFYIYKFRTMRKNAEDGGVPQLAQAQDKRLTSLGCFLREHHLDEIPQMWNVLIGDMSFVGPRPERLFFINEIMKHNPNYPIIYRMKPGVTSRATIYNGYTDTMEKMLIRLNMDLAYYQERNFVLDMKLLGLTFLKIIGGRKF